METPFSGWDFSYITTTERTISEPLTWSYRSQVLTRFRESKSVLDMGTGGGEFLETLQPFPEKLSATEGYAIAKERLEPLGVNVYGFEEDSRLPFDDLSFSLVMNKHESYSPHELRRILTDNGVFITQQVGGKDMSELNRKLGAPVDSPFEHWSLTYAVDELEGVGFKIIDAKEEFPYTRFYRDGLYQIHKEIIEKGYIDFPSHRFFLRAITL
ncbi:class I SAM-dependent methyltransferase [Pseudalkalibacillus hwajinpoensis]